MFETSIRPRSALPLLAMLTLAATACDEGSTDPLGTPAGSYTLIAVNGSPLPFTVAETTEDKLEITGGSLTLSEGGTCSSSATFRRTQAGTETSLTETEACSWSSDAGTITITHEDGAVVVAAWSGDRVTMSAEGLSLTFDRQ